VIALIVILVVVLALAFLLMFAQAVRLPPPKLRPPTAGGEDDYEWRDGTDD